MSTSRRPLPKYRRWKSVYAVVRIAGKNHFLGAYGTPESKAKYDRLIAAWVTAGRPRPWDGPVAARARGAGDTVLVAELIAAYLIHARAYYRKGGKPTSELALIRASMEPLARIHGSTRVVDFGPTSLREVREHLLHRGKARGGDGALARVTVNKYVSRIRAVFRWGVSEEIVPATVYHAMTAVDGLRRNRTTAPETEGVHPVPQPHIDAVVGHLPKDVATMVQIQLLTGMRPGEVVAIRGGDIEIRPDAWIYRPPAHKTEHHDRHRVVAIGPRAIALLRPLLQIDLRAPLFPSRSGKAWTEAGYRRAITRACERAQLPNGDQVPRWNPRQLRKNFATQARARFGLDAAQVALGHAKADTTEIYAELDLEKALRVVREIG